MAVHQQQLKTLAEGIAGGALTAEEVVGSALQALERAEGSAPPLHAFLSWDADLALLAARNIDERIARGEPVGPLAGVPVAVKDNICTLDFDTTCGSRMLSGYRSPYDATVMCRLRAADAVIIGKTNCDEFAMGSSTENSAFGATRNPHDPERVPGGSSGGSAAAVGAGVVPAALGSETGGSVRQPAAFCGVVGIKPTYGRVSRYGLVAFASSLDCVGTLGATVADAVTLLRVIAGNDPLDATTVARPPVSWDTALSAGARGLVVGVPSEYYPSELDGGMAASCARALQLLADAGAVVREISLPHTRFALPTYYVLATAEASSNLARYDGVRYGRRAPGVDAPEALYEVSRAQGLGAEVKRRIMLGTYVLSEGYHDAYYARAQQVRGRVAQDFEQAFAAGVDVIFTPTTPGPAFRLGEKLDDPVAMYLSDSFTVTANLAGLPAMSLPVGRSEGLPVGGQFLAGRWQEGVLFRAAAALERLLNP